MVGNAKGKVQDMNHRTLACTAASILSKRSRWERSSRSKAVWKSTSGVYSFVQDAVWEVIGPLPAIHIRANTVEKDMGIILFIHSDKNLVNLFDAVTHNL